MSTQKNIYQSAAYAYVVKYAGLETAGVDLFTVAQNLAVLCEDHDRRNARGEPVAGIPLLWIALAEAGGLTVDLLTGCITDGTDTPDEAVRHG